ncbi:MAG: exonuclease domain-containing protein [Halanaerobiales bacterium]
MSLILIIIVIVVYIYFKNKSKGGTEDLKMTNSNLKKKKIYKNKAVILDTETTGLSTKDEFIEITALLVSFDLQGHLYLIDKYTGQREPGVKISDGAKKVHGISLKELKNKDIDKEKLISIFSQSSFVVAHNADFDRKFIIKEIREADDKIWLCSMRDIKWKRRGFASKGLENLLNDHGFEIQQKHRSESDAKALFKLLNSRAQKDLTYFMKLLKNNDIDLNLIDFEE